MSIIGEARFNFHHRLLEAKTLALTKSLVASNADVGSKLSVSVAGNLLRILAMQHDYPLVGGDKSVGQNLGKMFESLTAEFLRATFLRMQDLRPGAWTVQLLGNSGRSALCNFAQYEHLAYIKEVTSKDPKLAAALDIEKAKLNGAKVVVTQNELNIDLPQIVVVTAEPLPSRIASIAQGVGDIDCVYHFALYELIEAVNQSGSSNSAQVLDMLVSGNRLRDISDLPLDLAV